MQYMSYKRSCISSHPYWQGIRAPLSPYLHQHLLWFIFSTTVILSALEPASLHLVHVILDMRYKDTLLSRAFKPL